MNSLRDRIQKYLKPVNENFSRGFLISSVL